MKICLECNTSKVNSKLLKTLDKYKVPFRCSKCGSLKFPYEALKSLVFVWPDPVGKHGSILLPDVLHPYFYSGFGTVLNIGKGHWDKRKKKFIFTTVKVGNRVMYDRTVPWSINVLGIEDRKYSVIIMSEADIKALILKEGN